MQAIKIDHIILPNQQTECSYTQYVLYDYNDLTFRLLYPIFDIDQYVEETSDQKEDKEGDEGEAKPEQPPEYEQVNRGTAMWMRGKSDLSDDEYKEFYKHISHDFEDPLTWVHNRVEGNNEYTALLYLPKRAPWDMWDRDQKHGVKLYVKRVFIMDEADKLLPHWLRFVKGEFPVDGPLLLRGESFLLYVSRGVLVIDEDRLTLAVREPRKNSGAQYLLFLGILLITTFMMMKARKRQRKP